MGYLQHTAFFSGHRSYQTFSEKVGFWFADGGWLFAGILLGILMLYLLVWMRSRRAGLWNDLYVTQPPFDLGPSAIRYIAQRGYDTKCLTVGIINSALHGCYRIEWRPKGFHARIRPEADFELLSPSERAALQNSRNVYWQRITVTNRIGAKTRRMGKSMEKTLHRRFSKLFRPNLGWLVTGGLASLLATAGMVGAFGDLYTFAGFAGYLFLLLIFIITPLIFLRQVLRDRYWYGIAFSLLMLTAGLVALVNMELRGDYPLFSLAVIPLLCINVAAVRTLPTWSPRGQRVMHYIQGYRSYLQGLMSRVDSGELSMRDVARHVPYVMALDLDHRFTPYFGEMLTYRKYNPYQVFDSIHKG